jgi:1,4-dihydroxy-6-naphthoate synthase
MARLAQTATRDTPRRFRCEGSPAPLASAMAQHPEIFTLGHSPDPDDAFMFYAMAENKIDLRGYRFEHRLEDIQTLNERATRGELHISAISIHAYAYVSDRYALLPCGASMGDGYGPMIVAPNESEFADPAGHTIAVPGKMTSAFLALQLYLGHEFEYVVVPFDQIFDAVKNGQADFGLIIHEGQLTYQKSGFKKIVDLGEWWKRERGLPLPLGGNVLRKDIAPEVQLDLLEILHESIAYGLAHHDEAVRHSMPYARDMDESLAGKFIGMYVNDYTLDYGESGRAAIREFLGEAESRGLIPKSVTVEFVGESPAN